MHRDRFGLDLTTNFRIFPDREHPIRSDLPLHFSIDKKFFLKANRAFDFDIPRENAFPSVRFRIHFSTDSGWDVASVDVVPLGVIPLQSPSPLPVRS